MTRQSRKDIHEALKDANTGCILLLIGVPGAFITLIAVVFIAIGFREIYNQERLLSSAIPVEATIQSKRVETSTSSSGTGTSRSSHTIYIPIVEYTYEYEGRVHMGESLWPTARSMKHSGDARAAIAPFVPRQTVTAYVDPEDPATAFLLKEWTAGPYLAVSVAPPIIAFVIALGVLLAGYRNLTRATIAAVGSLVLTGACFSVATAHYFQNFDPVSTGPALTILAISSLVSLAPIPALLKARSLRGILLDDMP